ncbi:MAG: VWA domain-containing protein [Anaerolineaceae bacterium]
MNAREIVVGLQTDIEVISKDESTSRIVEIEIQAPVAKDEKERQPLNLALVLDRSGSMQGNKLRFAKQAALHVVDLLDEKDHLAVVVYDDSVDILSESGLVTAQNRRRIKQLLQQVECGGCTCLSGGWLNGCQQIAATAQNNSINRTLLLSDGLANAGITDVEELSHHARELASMGVSTSTFGVGNDFNEHLMEAMANMGQGNFYFIESPQDIPNIFASEFKELSAITARDIELKLELPNETTHELFGGYEEKQNTENLVIPIGSMYSGKSQMIYVRVNFPAQQEAKDLVLKAAIYARGESGELLEATNQVTYSCVSKAELEKAAKNIPLLERFATVELAEVSTRALKMEREGRNAEASNMLSNTLMASAPYTDPHIHEVYRSQADRMKYPMSEEDRKGSHYENYRRRRMQHRDEEEFRMDIISGHLVMHMDRFLDVLDTGSPFSIGNIHKFLFMGDMFRLHEEYLGVDTHMISQQVGEQIDAMLGMDILQNYSVTICNAGRRVYFSKNGSFLVNGERMEMDDVKGIPFIQVPVNGEAQKLFLDTGSPLNYLNSRVTQGLQQLDTARDTYPGIGEFTTPIYELPVTIAGVTVPFRFGNLPQTLESSLMVSGIQGILGIEIYRHFDVAFAFPEHRILIAPANSH